MDRKKNYIEIFSYTVNCSWLDVVEIHFRTGTDPGIIIINYYYYLLFSDWLAIGLYAIIAVDKLSTCG